MTSVLLDPYVALSLLDHYMRNPTSTNEDGDIIELRAEGFLMGGHVGNVTQIRGFVPSLNDELMRLTMRSSPRDLAVGWYASELQSEKDRVIQSKIDSGVDRPVFLFVQVPSKENNGELKFRAYVKNRMEIGGQQIVAMKEVPCKIDTSSNEAAIALDALCTAFFPKNTEAADPTRLADDAAANDYYAQLRKVKEMLSVSEDYCNAVIKGKVQGSKDTARSITQILTEMEVVQRRSQKTGVVEARSEDALMLQYMGRLLSKQVDQISKNSAQGIAARAEKQE